MKFTILIPFTLLLFGVVIDADGHGVQILSPNNNHSFVLEIDELKKVLEADAIKDRHVVVVSIVGAFRQGKSFLLNFFLKYLEAQYKKHDVLDWLGENEANSTLSGFKWASGRKRKTVGIWMWSEIYTHDFANGEKVAIILLDTQGIFDDKTSVKEYTTIFALSTMVSSIQCYNLMQNIGEDHLQHLQLFTEYGKFALQQTNTKQFQKLLFIVRDWPYPEDTYYGWHQEIIDEILDGNEKQTVGMQQLRKDIKSSFNEIGSFLLPHPGMTVAQKKDFNGTLKQIEPEFLKFAKDLAQDLFAPENLLIKNINGQNVRARDLVHYLQEYTNFFNNNTLPEPQPMYEVTARVNNLILANDCVNNYSDFMEKQLIDIEPYFKSDKLMELHERAKIDAITKFKNIRKLGSDTLINAQQNEMEKNIEKNFVAFQLKNQLKRNIFVERSNLHNEKICSELKENFKNRVLVQINNANTKLSNGIFPDVPDFLKQFDSRKMGDDDISDVSRKQFESASNDFLSMVNQAFGAYNDSIKQYNNFMAKRINEVGSYFKQNELKDLHELGKENSKAEFTEKTVGFDEIVTSAIKYRMLNEIDKQYPYFELKNQLKHEDFVKRANKHNENLIVELMATIKQSVRMELDTFGTILDETEFSNVLNRSEEAAIQDFDLRKMDDEEMAAPAREKLIQEADVMHSELLEVVRAFNKYLKQYSDSMEETIDESSSYLKQDELEELHRKTKEQSLDEFDAVGERVQLAEDVVFLFHNHLNESIYLNFLELDFKNNEQKINHELVMRLVKVAIAKWSSKIIQAQSGWCDNGVNWISKEMISSTLSQFDAEKKGYNEIASKYRQRLEIELEKVKYEMKELNRKRLEKYKSETRVKTGVWGILGGALGAIFGSVGGPAGSVALGTLGAGLVGGAEYAHSLPCRDF